MDDTNLDELKHRGWTLAEDADADSYDSYEDDDFDDNILSDFENEYTNGEWEGLSKRDKLKWLDKNGYYPAQFLLDLTSGNDEELPLEADIDTVDSIDSTGTSSDSDEENEDTEKNILSALLDKKY